MSDPLSDAVKAQQAQDAARRAGEVRLGQEAHDKVLDDMAQRFAKAMRGAFARPYYTTRTITTTTWEKSRGFFAKPREVNRQHAERTEVCQGWTVADNYRYTKDTHIEWPDAEVVDAQGIQGDEIFIAEDGTWNRARISKPGGDRIYRGRVVWERGIGPIGNGFYGLREQLVHMLGYMNTQDETGYWNAVERGRSAIPEIHREVAAILARIASEAGRTIT